MDQAAQQKLVELLRTQPAAALGTLRNGAPYVSLVPVAPAADLAAFYIHISRLAHHTQDIEADKRVSLMIAEAAGAGVNPQTLARISLQGSAARLEQETAEYDMARTLYLARFPQSRPTFALADFGLYRIQPETGRFVASFGRIFNLTGETIRRAALAGA